MSTHWVSLPELTEEQFKALKSGRARFVGNTEEGIEYIEIEETE